MSHYGEHSTQVDKYRIKIGKPERTFSTAGYNKRQADNWLSGKTLKLGDINKHPITKK